MIGAAFLLLIASCKPVEERVVGHWQNEDQTQGVTFNSDGTAIFESYGRTVNAKYKFTDQAHAKFTFDSPLGELEGTQNARVSIEKDELTLEFESGLTRSYLRAAD
jgi:hypothetical protein